MIYEIFILVLIKGKLKKDDITMVFEVIDNINDKHIIKYDNAKLVLLDMIYNKVNYEKIHYNEFVNFAKNNNMEYKQLIYIANNLDEFKTFYNQIMDKDYKLNNNYIEGFVIEDGNNFMIKVKTYYYEKWKYLRELMEKVISTNKYNIKSNDELEIDFIKYLENNYKDKNIDINNINIIDERDNFYNNN